MALGWKLVYDGKTPPPGAAVAPDERLSWGRTTGLGAQHVVAMFGATFVFPLVMGLSPNLAIMMSGVATICFLLIVKNKVPSYLGTSASFVGGAAAIYAQGGGPQDVTGAILVAGVVLGLVGLVIHFLGSHVVNAVLPPVVTGAVVMLIGFNLAPVAALTYMPADPWIAMFTMTVVILMAVGLRGFLGRIAIFLGLIVGYLISWLADPCSARSPRRCPGPRGDHAPAGRLVGRQDRRLVRLPPAHARRSRRQPVPGRQPLRGGLAPAELLAHLHAAGAARGDRAGRGERRPRQGGGRDDQDRPRPDDGSRRRRGRGGHGHRQLRGRLAHDDVRGEHRGDGGDPGLLHRRLLRGRDRRHPAGLHPQVRRRSSAPPRVACSAGSRWCSTA